MQDGDESAEAREVEGQRSGVPEKRSARLLGMRARKGDGAPIRLYVPLSISFA